MLPSRMVSIGEPSFCLRRKSVIHAMVMPEMIARILPSMSLPVELVAKEEQHAKGDHRHGDVVDPARALVQIPGAKQRHPQGRSVLRAGSHWPPTSVCVAITNSTKVASLHHRAADLRQRPRKVGTADVEREHNRRQQRTPADDGHRRQRGFLDQHPARAPQGDTNQQQPLPPAFLAHHST